MDIRSCRWTVSWAKLIQSTLCYIISFIFNLIVFSYLSLVFVRCPICSTYFSILYVCAKYTTHHAFFTLIPVVLFESRNYETRYAPFFFVISVLRVLHHSWNTLRRDNFSASVALRVVYRKGVVVFNFVTRGCRIVAPKFQNPATYMHICCGDLLSVLHKFPQYTQCSLIFWSAVLTTYRVL
jgi:hypothetical protein